MISVILCGAHPNTIQRRFRAICSFLVFLSVTSQIWKSQVRSECHNTDLSFRSQIWVSQVRSGCRKSDLSVTGQMTEVYQQEGKGFPPGWSASGRGRRLQGGRGRSRWRWRWPSPHHNPWNPPSPQPGKHQNGMNQRIEILSDIISIIFAWHKMEGVGRYVKLRPQSWSNVFDSHHYPSIGMTLNCRKIGISS